MGPPNAGKSTLLNALLGQKVTIVTPKPQTTRNQIVGILTDAQAQIIFMDTPGLTQVRGRLSKTMIQGRLAELGAGRRGHAHSGRASVHPPSGISGPGSRARGRSPGQRRAAMIVVVNKVDLFSDKSRMLPLLTRLHEMWPRAEIFPVSALRKDGLPELKALIRSKLPEGPAQYPEDQISTASLRFMAAEIIREKLFLHLHQEVPYGVAVEVESWEEDEERGQTIIHAVIYVSRAMHKAMVIGRAGASIKEIGTEARKEIQELVGGKVHLELWVKVREHWSEDPAFLRELGLMAE